MENNIEDLIRDDFRKREIQPNANAFERLNLKLDKQIANKRKRTIRILAYAASFIGLVFILQPMFRVPDNKQEKIIITNAETKGSITKSIDKEGTSIAIEQQQFKKSSDKILVVKTSRKTIVIKESIASNSQEKVQSKILEKELATIKSIENEGIAFNDTTKKPSKIKEITDKELDVLLASANQSLPKNSRDSLVINAQSMLYEIEVEINKPLPEKVLLTIKTGTKTIKELIKSNDNKNK